MDGCCNRLPRRSPPSRHLVSNKTTLPFGTNRNRRKPLLEDISGLKEGTDFHLVFSPERVLADQVIADLRQYPELVGGISDAGAANAVDFYSAVLDFDKRPDLARANGIWDLGSAEASELAKLAETTYRDVNIGLAKQFARFAGANGMTFVALLERPSRSVTATSTNQVLQWAATASPCTHACMCGRPGYPDRA